MANPEQRVSAVVVNYNAGNHLSKCAASIYSEGIDRLIVVDNGSKDGSIEAMKEQLPGVEVIETESNLGFGAAANIGAMKAESDFVLFLNPDAVLQTGAVPALVHSIDEDESIVAVGPRIEDPDGNLYPSARVFPRFTDALGHASFGLFMPRNRFTRRYKLLDWDHLSARDIDWISGACMLVRRSAFESTGGFDPGYFMYMEDVDLCKRLHAAGGRIRYEPSAIVTHVQGVSADQTPYRMIVAHHRSLLRFNLRHSRGPARLTIPFVAMGLVARTAIACLHRARLPGKRRMQVGGAASPPSTATSRRP